MRLRKLLLATLSYEALPFYLLFLLAVVSTLGSAAPGVSDPDYFWHLSTGRYISETGAVPGGDPFSFSMKGAEWVLEEWPFQYLVFQIYQLWGHAGNLVMAALVMAVSLGITYRSARLFMANAFPALILTAAASLPMLAFTAPRPHLTTYLLFAVFLHLLLKAKYLGRHRILAWLPVIMIVWVNLHGGFMIGLALLLSFLAGEAVRWFFFDRTENGGARLVTVLGWSFLACILASFINIDGPQRLIYPLQVVGMSINADLAEWRPLNLNDTLPRIFAATLLAYLLALVWRRGKADLTEVALPIALSFAAFSAARHLPFAIMTLIPLTARFMSSLALRDGLEDARTRWNWLSDWIGKMNSPRQGKAAVDGLFCLLVAVAAAVLVPMSVARSLTSEVNPLIEVADYLEANPRQGRMLNAYGDGGYLIWRLFPETEVFIDGRAGLYRNAFVSDYFQAATGGRNWRTFLERWDFDYAVLPATLPLAQLMIASGQYHEERRIGAHSLLLRDRNKD
ncbi:hypothetical protein [Limibacillus halophilus]|uniref:Dolichyl-phosphate-mannose-protein mannosyltransferase n=1 Tax=Limibacillus halophilus TaxID=1579333 RepID=A0A839SVE0_9PROT|nr:hypothetical protein [Limibacillus halophilus]MBB3066278.1 hypothetical protein [Limibacillus halophilus]